MNPFEDRENINPNLPGKFSGDDYLYRQQPHAEGLGIPRARQGIVNRILRKQDTRQVTGLFRERVNELNKSSEEAVDRLQKDTQTFKAQPHTPKNIPALIELEGKIETDKRQLVHLIQTVNSLLDNINTDENRKTQKGDPLIESLQSHVRQMRQALGTVEVVCADGVKLEVDREKLQQCRKFLQDKFGFEVVEPQDAIRKASRLHLKPLSGFDASSDIVAELLDLSFRLEDNFSSHMANLGADFNMNKDLNPEFVYNHLSRSLKSLLEEAEYYKEIVDLKKDKHNLANIDPLTMSEERAMMYAREFSQKAAVAKTLLNALVKQHPELVA